VLLSTILKLHYKNKFSDQYYYHYLQGGEMKFKVLIICLFGLLSFALAAEDYQRTVVLMHDKPEQVRTCL